MRLLIMGPPGAGKGTQAAAIVEKFGIPAISTGDIFRANIAQGTELGLEVKRILDSGGLVGDDITDAIVADRLAEDDVHDGFLLDGYPRTAEQVEALDRMLGEARLDAAISLVADTEEVVARLLKRAQDSGRTDDTEETIRHRQDVYAELTQPVIEEYRKRGLLVEVNGLGEISEVTERIFEALAAVQH